MKGEKNKTQNIQKHTHTHSLSLFLPPPTLGDGHAGADVDGAVQLHRLPVDVRPRQKREGHILTRIVRAEEARCALHN